jgi:hypothetical protein
VAWVRGRRGCTWVRQGCCCRERQHTSTASATRG